MMRKFDLIDCNRQFDLKSRSIELGIGNFVDFVADVKNRMVSID